MELFRFYVQTYFLLVFISIINTVNVNYRLTSIFYGNEGYSIDEIDHLSVWSGKRPSVITFYTNWCSDQLDNVFNIQMKNIWNDKTIPLITWELFECNRKSQPGITRLVNNHTFDTYINQFSDRLKVWLAGEDGIYGTNDDRRAYLRLGHEMNGNWYPWSKNSTPNDYISAWRYVHNIFSNKSLDATRLQWVWSVNNADYGNYTAEEYWVGDDYVDWIGIDGYNFGESRSSNGWIWPNQVFDNMIPRVRQLSSTKPLAINEYETSSMVSANVSSIQSKTEWLNQFCVYISDKPIKMASYFNIEKETDWSIFGGVRGDALWNGFNVYTAYKNCLQSNDWIQPNSSNPRLITDDQFAGKL